MISQMICQIWSSPSRRHSQHSSTGDPSHCTFLSSVTLCVCVCVGGGGGKDDPACHPVCAADLGLRDEYHNDANNLTAGRGFSFFTEFEAKVCAPGHACRWLGRWVLVLVRCQGRWLGGGSISMLSRWVCMIGRAVDLRGRGHSTKYLLHQHQPCTNQQ